MRRGARFALASVSSASVACDARARIRHGVGRALASPSAHWRARTLMNAITVWCQRNVVMVVWPIADQSGTGALGSSASQRTMHEAM